MSSVSAVNSLLSGTATTTPSINISNILAADAGATTPGIDVTAAVTAALYADRAPERTWQSDQTTLTSQTTALTSMQTATEALANDMQSLNTLTGPLAARTVTSSDTSDITATAATGTVAGVHTVVVTTPATTGSWYSDLQTSATAPLSAGTFTITPTGGQPVSIAITGSLNDLATAINSAKTSTGASLGVTATVVSDTTGSRLALIANKTGTAADFSVATSNFQGTSWTSADMPTGSTLGANSVTLTSATGTAVITTTAGESYATLASAINNATIQKSYTSTQTGMDSTTPLTAGSVTTIQDKATGKTFTFTAVTGNTIGDLNNAISAAVTAGTLPGNVTGTISSSGAEVIADSSADQGIAVTSNESALGSMAADPAVSLGLTATAGSNANGTSLTIASNVPAGGGAAPTFTINEPAIGFTQSNAAVNAQLTVDGVPVQSASNTVTGAIPGVTLNVLGSSLGAPITLTVASDASQVSTAINQFVTDYNTALNLVNAQFADSTANSSGGTTASQGVLASDPTVVELQSTLEQAAGYAYKPTTGTTAVSTLGDLGITTNDDGSLSVDTATLNNALTNHPLDVQNFFEGTALNGFANSFYNSLNNFTSPANGAFKVDLSSISAASLAITNQINNFETGYIAAQQITLNAEFSSAEEALQALPQEMQQLNAELGFTQTNNNG
jgi:flagellar hook-associated protein 2